MTEQDQRNRTQWAELGLGDYIDDPDERTRHLLVERERLGAGCDDCANDGALLATMLGNAIDLAEAAATFCEIEISDDPEDEALWRAAKEASAAYHHGTLTELRQRWEAEDRAGAKPVVGRKPGCSRRGHKAEGYSFRHDQIEAWTTNAGTPWKFCTGVFLRDHERYACLREIVRRDPEKLLRITREHAARAHMENTYAVWEEAVRALADEYEAVVHLRRVKTDDVRIYRTYPMLFSTVAPSGDWWRAYWRDGNGACDCNRQMFFELAADEDPNLSDGVCGRGGYVVDKILRGREIVYEERAAEVLVTQPVGRCDGSRIYAYDATVEHGRGQQLETPCPGCRACQ